MIFGMPACAYCSHKGLFACLYNLCAPETAVPDQCIPAISYSLPVVSIPLPPAYCNSIHDFTGHACIYTMCAPVTPGVQTIYLVRPLQHLFLEGANS